MSPIDIDTRRPIVPLSLHGTPGARTFTTGHPHAAVVDAGRPVGVSAGRNTRTASAPVTGKVYALKDGSGYVALASDGHYYALDSGGSGLVYPSASGVVDASLVDVTHGPVRSMRPRPEQTAPHPQLGSQHRSESPDLASTAPGTHREDAPIGDAATAARTAHRLIAGDPVTALRSHARVSGQQVASLLR